MLALKKEIREFLTEAYSETHRFYHTLEHINSVLATIDEFNDQVYDHDAIMLAAWFHDVIYNVDDRYQFNEHRSSLDLVYYLDKYHPEYLMTSAGFKSVFTACMMILCTKSHSLETVKYTDITLSQISDISFFLDADLRILSEDREKLLRFEENIRKEFSEYDDLVYNSNRKNVLESFLAREKIYYSEVGSNWEKPARKNLKFLIERLS